MLKNPPAVGSNAVTRQTLNLNTLRLQQQKTWSHLSATFEDLGSCSVEMIRCLWIRGHGRSETTEPTMNSSSGRRWFVTTSYSGGMAANIQRVCTLWTTQDRCRLPSMSLGLRLPELLVHVTSVLLNKLSNLGTNEAPIKCGPQAGQMSRFIDLSIATQLIVLVEFWLTSATTGQVHHREAARLPISCPCAGTMELVRSWLRHGMRTCTSIVATFLVRVTKRCRQSQ